jgi:hypothetical protein
MQRVLLFKSDNFRLRAVGRSNFNNGHHTQFRGPSPYLAKAPLFSSFLPYRAPITQASFQLFLPFKKPRKQDLDKLPVFCGK